MSRVATARRAAIALLAAASAVLSVAGCGMPTTGPTEVPAAELPAALRSPSTTTARTGGPTDGVTPDVPTETSVFWVSDDRLAAEPVTFAWAPGPARLLAILAAGPGSGGGRQLRSAVPPDSPPRLVSVRDGIAVVSVPSSFVDSSGRDQALAVGQIVATLTSLPDVRGVEMRLGGEPVAVPTGDGSLVRRTLTVRDYADLLSPSPTNR